MKADTEKPAPKKQEITLYIVNESWLYSMGRDLCTVAVYFGAFALNKLTIDSAAMSFVFGLLIGLWIIARVNNLSKERRVVGRTIEDVLEKLETRLRTENFD